MKLSLLLCAIFSPALAFSQDTTRADVRQLEEVTVISSTRNNEKIENSPLKVEVLGHEELSEEASIKPGNIASILGDVSGVQIQQSSATSGNSNVRIQGLDGKYTQVVRDGMPLYDGFSGGFGILTIPPLDLQQIELVKGAASTLYGGGAIGGLINLVSRKPKMTQEADVLLNYSSLQEFNANAYVAKLYRKLGYTFFAGYTNQQAQDVNKDGLSDVAGSNSVIVHPRLYYYPSDKTTMSVGYSGTFDNRKGGDMLVLKDKTDAVHQYYEQNISQRHTAEYQADHTFANSVKLTLKGNYSSFDKNTNANTFRLKGSQASYYDEASVYVPVGKSNLVAGINIVGDSYHTTYPDTIALRSFSNLTAGVFGQFGWHIKDNTIIEAGLRLDVHNKYGVFVLPRIALFHRFNEHWATRAGFGMGYKTPNPLVQQTLEYNVQDLLPVSSLVKAERSYGYNAELNYKKEWGESRTLFINEALFYTQVNEPILFQPDAGGKIVMVNAAGVLQSMGSDTYVQLQLGSWELYAGYTYTDARGKYMPNNSFMPLTPRHRMAYVAVKEFGEKWRVGLEGSYMGSQYRYDNTKTPGYFFAAGMIQYKAGSHVILVLNGENLLDYRMSKIEGLYTGSITNPMFKPLWAPIDGRVINLSIRWKL